MYKFLFFAVVLLSSLTVNAEESAFYADHFLNQSQIIVSGGKSVGSCQAVRILPKWYLTAAHCVRPYCDKQCQITVKLLQGELEASAVITHGMPDERVLVPTQFNPNDIKSVRYDVALIRFDPDEQDYTFADTRAGEWLDKNSFLKKLKSSSYRDQQQQWNALQTARPKLWIVTNVFSRQVESALAVPALRPDGIYFQTAEPKSFHYFTELQHFMGPNFGVEKGMSGAGVITPQGEVLGIVSANLGGARKLITYNENDEPVGVIPYSSSYFLFTPLSPSNAAFIRSKIASFHDRGNNTPNFEQVSGYPAKQNSQKIADVFPQAGTAKEISSVPLK